MTRWIVVLSIAACSNAKKPDNQTPPAVDRCSPAALGLANAKPLSVWKLPPKCTDRGGPDRAIYKSWDDAKARIECEEGVMLGVRFQETALLVENASLSPATIGIDALDDGTTITFVSRQRAPCPGDPQPMPIDQTYWFLVPAGGADRAFAQASCTIDIPCK
jgi:hypothetical protein